MVELEVKVDCASLAVQKNRRLRATAEATQKFKSLSEYMYIFGRGTHFELDVDDMINADESTGIIFCPLEDKGVDAVLKRMLRVNFTKQVLIVMSNTDERPRNWMDCVVAGKFRIVNGQHTWKASKDIISGKYHLQDPSIVERVRKWECEVVWSPKRDHLHALSCKCNEGNVDGPYLSLVPATLIHCRHLWVQAGRPLQCWKNAKVADQDENYRRYEVHPDPIYGCYV